MDVNIQHKEGNTALMFAIDTNKPEIAMKILERIDVDINIQKEDGYTALMWAIVKNQPEIAKQILDKDGVDVNIQDKSGNTALMLAIVNNQPEIATQILEKVDIDINVQNKHGQTALMVAIIRMQYEIAVEILGKDNVNVSLLDKEGNTALMYSYPLNPFQFLRTYYKIISHKSFKTKLHYNLLLKHAILIAIGLVIGDIALKNSQQLKQYIQQMVGKVMEAISTDKNKKESWRLYQKLIVEPDPIIKIERANGYSLEAIKEYEIPKLIRELNEESVVQVFDNLNLESIDIPRSMDNLIGTAVRKLLLDRQAVLKIPALKKELEACEWPQEKILLRGFNQIVLDELNATDIFKGIGKLNRDYNKTINDCNELLLEEVMFGYEGLIQYREKKVDIDKLLVDASK